MSHTKFEASTIILFSVTVARVDSSVRDLLKTEKPTGQTYQAAPSNPYPAVNSVAAATATNSHTAATALGNPPGAHTMQAPLGLQGTNPNSTQPSTGSTDSKSAKLLSSGTGLLLRNKRGARRGPNAALRAFSALDRVEPARSLGLRAPMLDGHVGDAVSGIVEDGEPVRSAASFTG